MGRLNQPDEAAVKRVMTGITKSERPPLPGTEEYEAYKVALARMCMSTQIGAGERESVMRALEDYVEREAEFFCRFPDEPIWALGQPHPGGI